MKIGLIALILLFSSCASKRPVGDFIEGKEHYANTHEHNFQIWLKNQKLDIREIKAFKNELNCPKECKW